MNKKFKPDFDHLLETAYIVEGHECRDAAQGCCCRECSECEENYMNENYKSEKDTHCSDKCCGSDVKREDCTCSPDCEHCNCNNPLVEGHSCHDAARGCCCRGCSECEENYKHENYEYKAEESENYESEIKKSENWEAGTSKAPKGKSYDMSRGGAPSNVDAKKDGPGGRYRRTRPPSATSNKTHSEMEESDGLGLREIMDSLGKPNTNVPYGDDPEADNPDYNENNELSNIASAVGAVMNLPTDKELKKKAGGILGIGSDPVIDRARKIRKKAAQVLDKEIKDIESRL
jgi:hypothetical protein